MGTFSGQKLFPSNKRPKHWALEKKASHVSQSRNGEKTPHCTDEKKSHMGC
jgi:hypothetical protein